MIDWSYILMAGTVYALGVAGAVGISLLPMRTFQLIRKHGSHWHSSTACRVAVVLVAIAAAGAALYGFPFLVRVFDCLADMRCGANKAGGLVSLALFGACYAAFEVVALAAGFIARRRSVAAQPLIQLPALNAAQPKAPDL